jgi:hypothetical protein
MNMDEIMLTFLKYNDSNNERKKTANKANHSNSERKTNKQTNKQTKQANNPDHFFFKYNLFCAEY